MIRCKMCLLLTLITILCHCLFCCHRIRGFLEKKCRIFRPPAICWGKVYLLEKEPFFTFWTLPLNYGFILVLSRKVWLKALVFISNLVLWHCGAWGPFSRLKNSPKSAQPWTNATCAIWLIRLCAWSQGGDFR